MKTALVVAALLVASPLRAETDLAALTPAERAALGAEVRALLLDEPEIVQHALTPPDYGAAGYTAEAQADMDMLDALKDSVLDGADIALFVGKDCAECATAEAELAEISRTTGTTFVLHDLADPEISALAAKLELDAAPFYVMHDRILRGHMPSVVLLKYLGKS